MSESAVRCPGCKKPVVPMVVPALKAVVLFETDPVWVLLARPDGREPIVQGCVPHLCATEVDRARVKTKTEKNKG